jgi:release factor glutamine methyltransferase
MIFGTYYENNSYGQFWDWVTLGLRKFLRQNKTKLTSLLDLGTGPYAILSFYAHKLNENCMIIGADHCKELIDYAETINISSKIKFIYSDLFKNINGKFDFIIFNAPYIDLDLGKKLGVLHNENLVKRLSGGKNGIETISNFLLDVKNYLNNDGICALGVNSFYIKDNVIRNLIEKANLNLVSVSRNWFTKANIYIIKYNNKHEM